MESVDRLREWASDFTELYKYNKRQLNEIADAIEAEVAERYVELPRDADGEPIRVGDELCGYGMPHGGVFAKAISGPMVLVGEPASSYRSWLMWCAGDCRHHRPATVEDVLRECCSEYHSLLIEGMSDIPHEMPTPSEVIDKYAAKLRLAEGGEAS